MEYNSQLKRVEAYIVNVEQALEKIKSNKLEKPYSKIVELAELYARDARYYLEKGDTFTALACIAYAEGLIDALRWLGIVTFEWKPLSKLLERPRVVVAGTFDIVHPGHIELFRQAWLRGRVYAIIARDTSVVKFKGREPIIPEQQRLQVISAIRYVDKVFLGSETDILEPIVRIKPDIILLGPDQWPEEDWLAKRLEERGIEVKIERLKERVECPLCSATDIACRILKQFPREKCKDLT